MSEHGPNMSQHKALEPTPSRSLQKAATDIDDERLGLHSFSTACPQLTRFLPQDRPPPGEGYRGGRTTILLDVLGSNTPRAKGPANIWIYSYTHVYSNGSGCNTPAHPMLVVPWALYPSPGAVLGQKAGELWRSWGETVDKSFVINVSRLWRLLEVNLGLHVGLIMLAHVGSMLAHVGKDWNLMFLLISFVKKIKR